MVKHTLKILQCEHGNILKVCLTILNIMHERLTDICPNIPNQS